jgi:RND family efflux transporter MFP subunit
MIHNIFRAVRGFFTRLGWFKSAALIIAAILVISVGTSFAKRGSLAEAVAQNTTPTVTVASVSDLSQGITALTVGGTVQSQTEATVRAEKSGKVTAIYSALGNSVAAGAIVAEIENASERAAVLQAQGAVQAATAGANVSVTTLAGAQASAVSTLLSAYSTVDTAVRGNIDPMFTNPESLQRHFSVDSSNSQAKIDTDTKRGTISTILTREASRAAKISTSDDLVAELNTTENELRAVRDFLDTVITTLNGGIATNGITDTMISTYKSTATGARTSVTTALSSVTSALQSLTTAQQNTADGSGSASASQAALTQAQGTLAAARANLEKSIIRAPISGTINSLSLKQGDYVQASSPVLTVANNHALEVVAYITANDAPKLSVGAKATIDTNTTGVITRIAPAIDPLTKKIEVRIGITGNTTLINGQSVSVEITNTPRSTKTPTQLTIPLTALKIGTDGMSVFTVSASSTLESHPVTIGELLGDRVVITTGLTPEIRIVTDARGLRAGESVTVR